MIEQVHDPIIKQCITSMALNNNILKHNPCDNFCVIKNEHGLNHQSSKTVSLVLTRLSHPSHSYVHVLRCNSCDYLTLNPASLNEHVRSKHPSSLGFWTYSCCQCSSMSTEKSLMEEHLRLYHKYNDNPAGKLIERFHAPSSNESVASSVTTLTGSTIPLAISSAHSTPLVSSGLALNLVNAINAIQNAGKSSSCQGFTRTQISTTSSQSVVNPTVLPACSSSEQNSSSATNEDVEMSLSESTSVPTSESSVTPAGATAFAVSGSRRRKATTPGRIRLQTSMNADEHTSDFDEDAKQLSFDTASPDHPSGHMKVENVAADTQSAKRLLNTEEITVAVEVPDSKPSPYGPPSPKRQCTEENSKVSANEKSVSSELAGTRSQATSGFPIVLSIGNGPTDAIGPHLALNRGCAPNIAICSQSFGSLSTGSPFMGQLIPLSGLPENLLCGISTALLSGTNITGVNVTQSNDIAQSGSNTATVTFSTPPSLESQPNLPAVTSASAWFLTNQQSSLAGALNSASGATVTGLQPTLLVPVPTAAQTDMSSLLSNMKTVPSQPIETVTATPSSTSGTTASANLLRLSDLLEALKSVAAGGNLISSINLPVSSQTVSSSPSGTQSSLPSNTSNLSCSGPTARPESGTLFQNLHIPVGAPGLTGSSNSLATLVANLSSAVNTTQPTSVPSVAAPSISAPSVVSASGLLSQLALAAAAAAAANTYPLGAITVPSGTGLEIGATPATTGGSQPGTNPSSTAVSLCQVKPEPISNDQALDMSVRSGEIISATSVPTNSRSASNTSSLNLAISSTTPSPTQQHQQQTVAATGPAATILVEDNSQIRPSVSVIGKQEAVANLGSVHGVVEALNAALKGGLKQRLVQTSTNEVSSHSSLVQCLTSLTGQINPVSNQSAELPGFSVVTPVTTKNMTGLGEGESLSLDNSLLKAQLAAGTHSVILPLPPQTSSSVTATVVTSAGLDIDGSTGGRINSTPTSSNAGSCSTTSSALFPPHSQLVSLAQLQAIMAALANSGTVSISAPFSQNISTPISTSSNMSPTTINPPPSHSSTPTITSSISPSANPITTALQQATTQNNPLLSVNQVLLNSTSLPNPVVSTPPSLTSADHSATMYFPTLNSLNSVCGLTLAANATGSTLGNFAGLSTNSSTSGPCLGTVASALKTIPISSGEALSLTSLVSGSGQSTPNPNNPIASTLFGNPAFINLISSSRPSSQTSVALNSAAAVRLLNSLTGLTSSANLLTSTANPSTSVSGAAASFSAVNGSSGGSIGTLPLFGSNSLTNGGTFNVLDSPQAFLAAAAANNANHITLTNLRAATLNGTTTTSVTMPANARPLSTGGGPIIGLLDPKTGLQLRVADVSSLSANGGTGTNLAGSTFLTPTDLASCLATNGFVSSTEEKQAGPKTSDMHAIGTPSAEVKERQRRAEEKDLSKPVATADLESLSPYDSHPDDDWDSSHEDSVAVQANLQSIYSGLKTDPLANSGSPNSNLANLTSTLLSAVNRRNPSSSRSPGLVSGGSSSRRGMSALGSESGQGQTRPHRQNFTPQQNRILTDWYQTHQAKPYPSTDDTKELATISGLSYSQVKKWFANKRARSTSSGMPKPTPPLAPDSSPDPSAAAAIVAAAMAAASSAATGLDDSDCGNPTVQSYLLSGQHVTPLNSGQSKLLMDVDLAMCEEDSQPPSEEAVRFTPSTEASQLASANENDPPLTVVSEIKIESSEPTDVYTLNEAEQDDVLPINSPTSRRGQSNKNSEEITDSAASPPTMEVPIISCHPHSPANDVSSTPGSTEESTRTNDAITDINPTGDLVEEISIEEELSSTGDSGLVHESISPKEIKGLRHRGLLLHSS
ncbi:unnamed protein product [Calicophoron daubneyi]|uniref:Homeobox domain-containing protein n=1 Tax=Calicophoron daubneyi TaxID=300641 RepID=A0AAV2TR18_CALDB